MKNSLFFKALLLILCLCLAFSIVGCQKNGDDNVSSNISSEEQISSEDPTVPDEPSSEPEDTTELPNEEDLWVDEVPGDELPEYDDDEMYFEETVNVANSSAPTQTNFLGMNAVYHCYTYMYDSDGRNYTEEQAQLEFNRLQNTGVKIVRTYYNHEFAYDKATSTFNWESDDMKAVYKWMKELQKRDISVALNTGWSLRGCYIPNYYTPWLGCYVEGDLETTAKNNANFIRDSLNQFRAHGINNIDYLILFTEPSQTSAGDDPNLKDWNIENLKNYTWEESYDFDPNTERWFTCSRAIHDALVADGTRSLYKTVGPNTSIGWSAKDSDIYMTPLYYFAIKYASDFVDIYSDHRYPTISQVEVDSVSYVIDDTLGLHDTAKMAHDIGKEFWYDETNLRGPSGLFKHPNNIPSQGLHIGSYFADSMNHGVQNIMWWYLFDQQWPDNHTNNNDEFVNGMHCCGLIPSLMESYIPETSYYSYSLLSKYFGNLATVYKAEAEYEYFNCGVQKNKDGEWSICISNIETDPGYIEINFEENIGNKKFYRHVYKAFNMVPTMEAEIVPADKIITTKGDCLADKIPANSVVVYTTIKD